MIFDSILNKQFKINFLQHSKKFILFSILLIILTTISLFYKGLNKGIDFEGGVLLEIRWQKKIFLKELRNSLAKLKLGDVSLQNIGSKNDVLIRVGLKKEENSKKQLKNIDIIKNLLRKQYPNIDFRRVDFVGPIVGSELIKSGITALIISFLAILFYIWIRFSYIFGAGALIALFHDVFLTIGFYSITGLEFNLTSIAAILTIIGYSINDSVVIYDRIRENNRKYRRSKISDNINLSLNQILNRTLLTSFTTIVAVLALIFLGGDVLKSFSIGVLFGVIVGTYSSIYIASSFVNR